MQHNEELDLWDRIAKGEESDYMLRASQRIFKIDTKLKDKTTLQGGDQDFIGNEETNVNEDDNNR